MARTAPTCLLVLTWLATAPASAGSDPAPVTGLQYRPLQQVLAEVLTDPLLADALIGARVDSLTAHKTVFTHNPDMLVNPASVTKVFTTAAALALLHPSYRFKTELYVNRDPEDGVIKGPLYVKGHGDPFLVNERMIYLANELRAMGIKRIDGPLILDDTFFDPIEEGPGWAQDASPRPYMAPMGALSLNFNTVAVLAFPAEQVGAEARLELVPDSDHFDLENKVVTSLGRTRVYLDVDGRGTKTRIKARGRVSLHHLGSRHYCRVTSPSWYFGRSFRQILRQAGIRTRQTVRRGQVPRWADKLYVLRSPALGELIRKVNKRSQNFMAEQLYKVIGAELLGPPATWHKGQQALAAFLEEEVGIAPGSYVLHNGSGLNDVNRVTASQVVAVLSHMWGRFELRPDFLASLAVAGADGTVTRRFRHPAVRRSMRLKTGSLENVRALAGYVHTRGDEVFAFCVLISRYQCSGWEAIKVINRFATALARSDADWMVVDEVDVEPIAPPEDGVPVGGDGPEAGPDAQIPIGEKDAYPVEREGD